jgi:hypothetical protein
VIEPVKEKRDALLRQYTDVCAQLQQAQARVAKLADDERTVRVAVAALNDTITSTEEGCKAAVALEKMCSG